MERQQTSRTLSSDDESISRVLIHSAEQTSEHTLPLNIIPSSSSMVTTTRRTIQTQTIKEIQSSVLTKSTPSFAETQLLSVYYPSQNPKNPSKDDKCVFVEQQDRQPIRYRLKYDPSSSAKSTQTLPLSTHGSTLIVDGNEEKNSKYDQYLKIHSGSQRFSPNFNDEHSLSNELIEQSKYSYEEYIVNLNEQPIRTASSSSTSSSVTTVIEQTEELDSDQTSHLTFDEINTQSSEEQSIINNNQRISSWPPVPDEILLQNENDEQKRPSRVQFSEQLVHVIPASATSSLNEESITPPAIIPRKSLNDIESHYPINQSKWIKTHLDNSDIQTNSTSSRVNTLRSFFEQSSTLTPNQRIEPEEKPSKHGVEIRFRINDPNIYHAEPAKVLQPIEKTSVPISPFNLDQIEQITGKKLKNSDEIGHYLSDGHTWQWNEIFWLSLTTSQRDQLKDLEQKLYSHKNNSSNEIKRFKTTLNITGAGAWQQNKPQISTSDIIKYTEINSIDENQTSSSVFGSTPNSRIDSQESIDSSINQNKINDSQITISESGYNSADDQQKFRPISSTIIEESIEQPIIDPLSYEEFIIDYLSTYGKNLRSNNGKLIILIDEQEIHMTNISIPLSNQNIILSKNIYLDAINQNLSPFETELNQLVIFISDEAIILPLNRWIVYRKKYNNAQWIKKLKRINRNIPSQLIPTIVKWISDHAIVELDMHKLNIDGLMIPLIGRLGLHILDLYNINNWNEILKYLIHIGYVSYNSTQELISIANSELYIKSSQLNEEYLEFLIQWLDQLNQQNLINITEENDIIINAKQKIFIKHEHIDKYMKTENINMNDIAHILLLYNYINENIQLNKNEFIWLESIIRSIKIIEHLQQTEIELFDGENTQILRIPYEHMLPTKNSRIIAIYLFENGNIRYDDNEKQYAYRYIPPKDKINSNQHEDLIDNYVEFINNHDGINYDNNTNLLLLENPLNGSELYLTSEHTKFIKINNYRREDMKYILKKNSQIKQDEFNNWLLYYNNQCIQIPSIDEYNEQVYIHHSNKIIDPKLKLLFPFNKSLRLIQKTPSTTTLDIQQPNEENNYTIDPLLILANYIHRSGTIYQDEFNRLIIKLYQDEIVIPYIQAISSIQAINTSPNRTGTIIARLINSIGKVESNKNGGIIITIGNNSIELSNENLTSSIIRSKSSSSIGSIDDQRKKSSSQTSLSLRPRLLIVHGDEMDPTTRFYMQYTYEYDQNSTSVMMLPNRSPVQPTHPHLIAPEHYQDMTLRDASVHVYGQDGNEIYYENLAQYLTTKQTDLSSRTVRRMLKFSSRDEYFAYLNSQISAIKAEQLVQESEELNDNQSVTSYNVQNGRSPQTINSQNLTTPEKNITLPRNTTLSGQSHDGESESRATVSRSVSAAGKVATSKSDTMKSNTSSSAASSREYPIIPSSSTVIRTQSLVSPNRTSGSKGGGDEIKKEKKSKFRTPSFLRKRKEKKEAANKDKAEK